MLGLHAPGLGARLEDAERRRVVDVDGRLRQAPGGVGHARPVAGVEVAGAHLVGVDLGLRAQEALDELLLGHLEAEHQHALPVLDARVLGDVEREGRLAHGGPPGDDDEVARLET